MGFAPDWGCWGLVSQWKIAQWRVGFEQVMREDGWVFRRNKEMGRGGRESIVFCGRRRKGTDERRERGEREENKNPKLNAFKFYLREFNYVLIVLFIYLNLCFIL